MRREEDTNINNIATRFSSLDQYQKTWRETKVGLFSPSPVRVVSDVLKQAQQRDLIPQTGKFLDLGCGDGRIVCAAAQSGYEAYGIEDDGQLFCEAEKNQRIFPGLNMQIARGNFTKMETWDQLKLRPGDIDIFYNYANNVPSVLDVIDVSKHNSILLFLGPKLETELEHLETICSECYNGHWACVQAYRNS